MVLSLTAAEEIHGVVRSFRLRLQDDKCMVAESSNALAESNVDKIGF